MGVILRYAFVEEISWLKFKNFLHGHSHVAMLGWVYMGIYALFIHSFLPAEKQADRFYHTLFLLTQISVVGMLISFPVQGYGALSITFSTLHTLLSYLFAYRFWKDISKQSGNPAMFARAAIVLMLLSTVALWIMPPIMIYGYTNRSIYYMSIQFYLHFQFNGWFTFAILALFFHLLDKKGIAVSQKTEGVFFWMLLISTFFTYALALAWAEPLPIVFAANSLGVILQLAAMVFFAYLVRKSHQELHKKLSGWGFRLIKIAFALFALKVLMQAAVVVPSIATVAYTIRNYVIGFIHLVLLGVITQFLLGYASIMEQVNLESKLTRSGLLILLIGFFASECILFLQGTLFWGAMGFMPYYYELLFAFSLLMPIGVGAVTFGNLNFQGKKMV
jgi:hypothetical protein